MEPMELMEASELVKQPDHTTMSPYHGMQLEVVVLYVVECCILLYVEVCCVMQYLNPSFNAFPILFNHLHLSTTQMPPDELHQQFFYQEKKKRPQGASGGAAKRFRPSGECVGLGLSSGLLSGFGLGL